MTASIRRRNWVYALIALVIATMLIYWAATTENSSSSIDEEEEAPHGHESYVGLAPDEATKYGIIVDAAKPLPLKIEVQAPGKVVLNPNALAHVVPQVSGIARHVLKNVGQQVDAHDVLAVLESREMAESKAAYLAALKREELASSTLLRERNLYDSKISASQDFFDAQNRAEEALIELQLAEQHLLAIGLSQVEIANLDDASSPSLRVYEMRAPITGTVIQRHLTTGELVDTNHEAFTIANMKDVWVELSISPKDLPYIKPGQEIEVKGSQGKTTLAEVLYISPLIDEGTRTATAIAVLDNRNGAWAPGNFVSARIVVDTIPVAVSVPKGAVQEIDGEPSLFIAQDSTFEIRPVRLGRKDSENYEVLSGLEVGEPIALGNTFLLKAEHEKHEAEHMD